MLQFIEQYRITFAVMVAILFLLGLLNPRIIKNPKLKVLEYFTLPICGVLFISLLNNIISEKPLTYLNFIHYVEDFNWIQVLFFFIVSYYYANRE
jgi:hypothetical protein